MNAFTRSFLVLYVPVLHQGYINLFERYRHRVEACYVFGSEMMKELQPGVREIRSMDPRDAVKAIRGLRVFPHVEVLNRQSLAFLQRLHGGQLIVVDDEASRQFAELYLSESVVVRESVFLRWDAKSVNSGTTVNFDRNSIDLGDRRWMELAEREAKKSSCWWRRVGAVVVDPHMDHMVLAAHNKHMPSEHTPYAVGDPRDFVRAGTSPELAATIHAESTIIAMAAHDGIVLKGTHMYITVFPCGPCASVIAESGISRLYFASGCAYLDGEGVLRSRGVEIIHVE